MSVTPILGITELAANQGSKEVTINDMTRALEGATNATLAITIGSAPYTLSEAQFSRNYIFRCNAATLDTILYVPENLAGAPASRAFVVRNTSGFAITVRSKKTAPGTSVIVPNNSSRLLDIDGQHNVIVAAEPATVVALSALTDTPNSYAGQAGKVLAVNVGEDAVEFISVATELDALNDVDLTTPPSDGQTLVFDDASGKWKAGAAAGGGASNFLALTDTPAAYTGKAGLVPIVNATETGLAFSTVEAEAVEFHSSTRWRIRSTSSESSFVAIAEIAFLDGDGTLLSVGGTASASSESVSGNAADAFDSDIAVGWTSADPDVSPHIEYEFTVPVIPRTIRIFPNEGFPEYTPYTFVIEYYNGTTWIDAGIRTPGPWVASTPQIFRVNGFPLASVSEAPVDGNKYVRKDSAWSQLTGNLVPNGGTTGQALMKLSAADGDLGFVDPRKLFTTVIQVAVTDPNGSALGVKVGAAFVRVSSAMNGMKLTGIAAAVTTTSSTGEIAVGVYNATTVANMLSTNLTIDALEGDSSTAAVEAVVNAANATVATGNLLRIDIGSAGAGAKGLIVELQFKLTT